MKTSRRTFVGLAAAAPFSLYGARALGEEPAAACYDPASLSLSQRSRRRSLGYLEQTDYPAKHCSLCSFFSASAAGCGTCQMLTGGPVNAGGLCTSFAARAASKG